MGIKLLAEREGFEENHFLENKKIKMGIPIIISTHIKFDSVKK